MATVPKRVAERISAGIKRYQPILAAARTRDVGEADTVTIIKDLLAEIFGYDKYSEVTSDGRIFTRQSGGPISMVSLRGRDLPITYQFHFA